MKRSATLVTTSILLIALVSCSKEKNGATAGADITGSYKFTSSQVKTTSTVQSVSGSYIQKTVTTSDYTTQNNTGTVTIDASKFISNNISYTVHTTAKSTLYENGAVSDTFSFPFQFTLPSTSGTSTYKKVGADSIYFQSGSMLIGSSATAAQPAGAKIKFENGKLMLYVNATQSTTSVIQGETVTNIASVVTVTTLQKQ